MDVTGPLSADGFFARYGKKGFEPEVHGVLAMYHDQGLGPYKILSQGAGVNIIVSPSYGQVLITVQPTILQVKILLMQMPCTRRSKRA